MPKRPATDPTTRLLEIITETAERAASETNPDTRARRFTAGLAGALADIAPAAAEPIASLLEDRDESAEIDALRIEIGQHLERYHNSGEPIISDAAFDALLLRLHALETRNPHLARPDSPTQRVGAAPAPGAAKVAHQEPMLSISAALSEAEVFAWDQDIRADFGMSEIDYSVELKLDGVAIAADYCEGELVRAATRGDGWLGEDVTDQVVASGALPLRIADRRPLRIVGELHQPRAAFQATNARRAAAGKRPLATPRGAASGALRLADQDEIAARALEFAAFHAIAAALPATQGALLAHLGALGFSTPPAHRALGIAAALEAARALATEPGNHACDGVVIKAADLADRHVLGTTSRAPHWCIAIKHF